MPELRHSYGRHDDSLLGRAREMTTLQDCLRTAFSGRGSLVLIGGEAGIGKTALVQQLTRHAKAEGAVVLNSSCYDLTTTPPYGLWREVFSDLLTPAGTPALPFNGSQHDERNTIGPDAVFVEAHDVLVNMASSQPLVLILEDLQWSDAASLELLRYIARQIDEARLLLVGTYRDTDLDSGDVLRQYLPALLREAQATLVNLRPLDADAVRDMTRHRYPLSHPDESRLVEYLQDRAQGNPFFIRELLRMLEEERSIIPVGDHWELGDLGETLVPPLVRQVIEDRLARLDRQSRDLLAAASVIGQNVPLDLWRAASGATDDGLSAAIQSALRLQLIEETPATPGLLRFTHALVRETLYYGIELPQRCSLHEVVGEELARQPAPDPDAVAYHLREAGHGDAAKWLMVAGERAQHLYAWRVAADRFEATLEHMNADPATARARGWLMYRIGLLLRYADPDRGTAYLSDAERLADETGDAHLAAYACADRGLIRCLVGDVRRGLAEMRKGTSTLDRLPAMEPAASEMTSGAIDSRLTVENIRQGAIDLIGSSEEMNVRQGALVFWLAWAGRYTEAIEIGEPYVTHRPGPDARIQDALGDALAGLGHAFAALGRPDEALESFAKARDTYQGIDHHFKVGNTAIYELSEAFLPYRADHLMERQWLAEQAEAG